MRDAKVIVEKPFGRDLALARELNTVTQAVFSEASILRVDHRLGREAIMNVLYFHLSNSLLEPVWNRPHIVNRRYGNSSRATKPHDLVFNIGDSRTGRPALPGPKPVSGTESGYPRSDIQEADAFPHRGEGAPIHTTWL